MDKVKLVLCHILVFYLFLKPALNMVFEKKTNSDFT